MNTFVSNRCKNTRFVVPKSCLFQAIVAVFAALATANAGLIAAPSAKIVQGPSTRTTVVGPDGSAISSVAPGGSIVTEDHAGLVAHTAPVVAAHTAYAAPVLAHSAYAAPVVSHSAYAYGAPVAAAYAAPVAASYAAPVVAARATYAAPALGYAYGGVAHNAVDTVVAGPSGTIATSKTVHSPVAYAAPLGYAHHGLYY